MKKLNELITQVKIAQQLGGGNPIVDEIIFDSRKAASGKLFVAMEGTAVDGHRFIPQVFEAGCRVVVCEKLPTDVPSDAIVIQVPNSSECLGQMASAYYDFPSQKLKLVGVTGTNGKTTTATLLYHLVQLMGFKAGLFSTVTNYIGTTELAATHTTPDAVTLNKYMHQMVEEGCDFCFMEVSSHALAQHRIAGLKFTGALFTNITHDHLDYHLTFKAYLEAKKSFFDGLDKSAFSLVNGDDKNGMVMVQNSKSSKHTYSLRSMADFKCRIIESLFEGMQLEIEGQEIWTQFVGDFNAQNLMAVYGSAVLLGFKKEEIAIALSQLKPVNGRFETIRSKMGRTAIVDYAHTPDALKNVIETINEVRQANQQLITVVGAGGDRDATKRPVMAKEAVLGSSKVILTSDNPRSEEPEIILDQMMGGVPVGEKMKVLTIVNRREAIRAACMMSQPGDIILIAGKGHETYQEIKGIKHHFDDREIVRELFETEL